MMGGVANDKVFNTVELYFDGLIVKSEAINRLRYEKPNMQICLRTENAIENYLHFEGSEQILSLIHISIYPLRISHFASKVSLLNLVQKLNKSIRL